MTKSSFTREDTFDLESLSKADLVRIVQRALSDPDGFSLWLRRELSSQQGEISFEREIEVQIQELFGNFDNDTEAFDWIESIRSAVATGAATADQGASWALNALVTADEAIANHEDCEFEYSCDLEDLSVLALDFLVRSSLTGKALSEGLLTLLGLEYMSTPHIDLEIFAQRLGAEGLEVMRSALEGKKYPDRRLLTQLYELQQDRGAWIALKLASSDPDDQIAALEWIKREESPLAASGRAGALLAAQVAAHKESLPVRKWWVQLRQELGDPPEDIAEDAWATFQRQPSHPDAWCLLESCANHAGSWDRLRKAALGLLEAKEGRSPFEGYRHVRIRIARSEGRSRDAWEIARLGLPRNQMLEAISLAAGEWPDEARLELERILESSLRGMEHSNSQGLYQEFANLLSKGKVLFGKEWLGVWAGKAADKYPKRTKLLQMIAKA